MVAMIDLTLPPALFGQYTASDDEIEFMIDADDLKSVVSDARKDDSLTLSVTQQHGTYTLHTEVEREEETLHDSTETLEYDPADRPSTANLEFAAETTMDLDYFLDAFELIGETFQVGVNTDRLTMWRKTDDRRSVHEFQAGSEYVDTLTVEDGPVVSTYSRDYLWPLNKLQHSVKTVKIKTGTDFPVTIEAVGESYSLSYTVAPSIDENGTSPSEIPSLDTSSVEQQNDREDAERSADAYAVVDESYANPVEKWFNSPEAEHRFDEDAARERAAKLEKSNVPVGVYAVTVQPVDGDSQ